VKLSERVRRPKLIKLEIKKGVSQKNSNEIQRIIWEHFKNPFSNKLQNLKEMDTFVDAYNLQKLNQEDTNHLNRSITSEEIEVWWSPNKEKLGTKWIHW
jgi:hypothetical protein